MANKGSIDLSKVIQGSDKIVQMMNKVVDASDALAASLEKTSQVSKTNIKINAEYKDLEKANEILKEMATAQKRLQK